MAPHRTFWNVVASAQALAWFLALPPLLKPYWENVWSQFSPLAAQVIMNETGLVYFLTYALVMLPIYSGNYSFFEQYKISEKPWAWRSEKKEVRDEFWRLTRRSLILFLTNYCVLVPILSTAKYFLLDHDISFSTGVDWPQYSEILRDNALMTLIHEFVFYWSHRLAHHPRLYRFHKIHHEYKQNTVLAATHEHPIDYTLTIALPALIAVVVVKPHSLTLFLWIGWIIMANIDDHCGYEFPWSPVRWFWFSNQTAQHEFHHSKNMGCFASKLNVYDKIFDSESAYLEWNSKRVKKSSKRFD